MVRAPPPTRPRCSGVAGVVIVASAVVACSLLVDTTGLDGRAPDAGDATDDGGGERDAPGPDSTANASCPDSGTAPVECVAKAIPIDGLVLWLRADDGVETTEDGRVIAWRDSVPKLRPGYVGLDARQSAAEAQPLRVLDTAGAAIFFGSNDVLELPPGFEDFSAGLSVFVAVWPQLSGTGSSGPLFALGYPPQQEECGRTGELSIGGYGVGYRVEGAYAEAPGVLDGRGWDVVSVVHDGWNGNDSCVLDAPVTLRRGTEIRTTSEARSLTKAVRSGTRVGRSMYYPEKYFNGKLGELLLYDRALDDAQVARVTAYLSRRWPRR